VCGLESERGKLKFASLKIVAAEVRVKSPNATTFYIRKRALHLLYD